MAGRGRKITGQEADQVVELYQAGMAMRTIAITIGRSYGAVNAVLHQRRIEISPRGGYRRVEAQVIMDVDDQE